MDELEFHNFQTYFYSSPAPERAKEAIRQFTAMPCIEDPLSWKPAGYFFTRMAQMYPDLVKDYEDLVSEIRTEAKPFILGMLEDLRSTPDGPINALNREARTATDNDLLWAEFLLTGNNEPSLRLINHLERPDVVRNKLEAWLTPPYIRPYGTEIHRQWKCEELRTVAGIDCDPRLNRIEAPGDLDCLCLMRGVDLAPHDRFAEIRQVLPFVLSDGELAEMGIKATAKWSLASNANRHPIVLSTCEEELARRKGVIKAALREIVEFTHRNREDYAKAMKIQLEAEQGDADAQCKLGIMYEDGQGVHRGLVWLVMQIGTPSSYQHAKKSLRGGKVSSRRLCGKLWNLHTAIAKTTPRQ